MLASTFTIGKINAHCPVTVAPASARLRVAHLLAGVDPIPAGLPPHAILCVRRVAVPRPLPLTAARAEAAWETNLQSAINDLYRRAVRPVWHGQPGQADAVLFLDEGELLAWLAVEMVAGTASQQWYWRYLRPNDWPPRSLAQVWQEAPQWIPAAVACLLQMRRAAPVLHRFTPAEAATLSTALTQTAGLTSSLWPWLETAVAASLQPAVEPLPARLMTTAEHGQIPPPDWLNAWQSEAAALRGLPPETQRLLGLSVALFHAPARVGTVPFVTEIQQWLERLPQSVETSATSFDTHALEAVPKTTPAVVSSNPSEPLLDPIRAVIRQQTLPLQATPATTIAAREPVAASEPTPPHLRDDDVAPVDRATRATHIESPAIIAPSPAKPMTTELSITAAAAQSHEQTGISTQLAGVFFLFNLFASLKLPACFAEADTPPCPLSGWALAELLGRTLLAPLAEPLARDPLWNLLAELDGRTPGEPLTAAWPEVAATYRMPADWLQRFVADESWRLKVGARSFALWNAAEQFPLVHLSCGSASPLELAQREVERYRVQGVSAALCLPPQADATLDQTPAPLPHWADCVSRFLRWLLQRQLRTATAEEAVRLLLCKRGQIFCTRTHLDVMLGLDEIALPVRCAGLDANPGWQRDLLRVVSFHFV